MNHGTFDFRNFRLERLSNFLSVKSLNGNDTKSRKIYYKIIDTQIGILAYE